MRKGMVNVGYETHVDITRMDGTYRGARLRVVEILGEGVKGVRMPGGKIHIGEVLGQAVKAVYMRKRGRPGLPGERSDGETMIVFNSNILRKMKSAWRRMSASDRNAI